ncbi:MULTISPECIES: replication-relaxation family protein [unclassified Streptomyces]|uniref:replication-relaxation family protein n=1 Tax=unclassified Streptomyces TaxID=2593676 RepID=UPI000A798153|nr:MULTISPECIES: replication-relaxation family protein [unclassified Streptomyces]
MPGGASRTRKTAAKTGADIRGEVLLALARLRPATPRQLKALLLPHQQGTDHVRRAPRNLLEQSPALVGRSHRAQQSYWYCTPAGLAEAAASAQLAPTAGRITGRRVAHKTGLREHGLVLVDTVIAFHRAEAADHADWRVEVAHSTPAGALVPDGVVLLPDGVVLLDDGTSAFVEIDRTTSYARLIGKPERYDAYRETPAAGRGNAARAPHSHRQETYPGPSLERAFPPVLFVFAPTPSRAAPATRETAFHERTRRVGSVNYRLAVATTPLPLLTKNGAGRGGASSTAARNAARRPRCRRRGEARLARPPHGPGRAAATVPGLPAAPGQAQGRSVPSGFE